MRPLRRRDLLGLLPASLLAHLARPRAARADTPGAERRFLFVFVDGGWDPTWVFAPAFDNPYVAMPSDDSARVTSGGLTWVSASNRPSVDAFFARHGARTCILNGLQVRSIAHERCTRILFTGTAAMDRDDIPSLLAAGSDVHLPLAHVVLSGPAYTAAAATDVVRVGASGQLSGLIDGSFVDATSPSLRIGDAEVSALEDAFVRARVDTAATAAARGSPARIADAYRRSLGDIPALDAVAADLRVESAASLSQLLSAGKLLGDGHARCAVVADRGFESSRWDHHAEITRQAPSYETLFANLAVLVDQLAATPGTFAETQLDEITIVVFSEMGRYPSLNNSGGKDHWMTTSAMLIGGGIRGDQVVGAYDANFSGASLVPQTGELDPDGRLGGVQIEPTHLGATLMALAGLDHTEAFGDEVEPLDVVLAE